MTIINQSVCALTFRTLAFGVSLLVLIVGTTVIAEEEADKQERALWTKYYASQLPKYEVSVGDEDKKPLTVDKTAKLRWGNPIRTATHGDVFVWTLNGRVQLIGNFFSYRRSDDTRQVSHEFHSMSIDPISINRKGKAPATIPGPGLKFEKIPNAPAPSPKRVARMAQMRMMAKNFAAFVGGTRDEKKTPLRALSQPLYRFETKETEEDGALFAYVMGTDPELFVSIEVRETDAGPKWHFAPGRFSHAPLELQYEENVVWQSTDQTDKDPGYLIQYIDVQPSTPVVAKDE